MRSISGPGRCTRTDLSLPISEVTLRLMQAPTGRADSTGVDAGAEMWGAGRAVAPRCDAPVVPRVAARPGRQAGGRREMRAAASLAASVSASAFSAIVSRRVANRSNAREVSSYCFCALPRWPPSFSSGAADAVPQPRELGEVLVDLAGVLLELDAPQSQRHRREVRIEKPRRDRDDALARGVVGERALLRRPRRSPRRRPRPART